MQSLGVEDLIFEGQRYETEFVLTDQLPPEELITTCMVLAFSGDRILFTDLVSRGWDIPGGHREPGEALLDCARRELLEEAGAEVRGLLVFGHQRIRVLADHPPPGSRYPFPEAYQVFWIGEVEGTGPFRPAAPHHARGAALFAPDEAREMPWVRRHPTMYEAALARATAPAGDGRSAPGH